MLYLAQFLSKNYQLGFNRYRKTSFFKIIWEYNFSKIISWIFNSKILFKLEIAVTLLISTIRYSGWSQNDQSKFFFYPRTKYILIIIFSSLGLVFCKELHIHFNKIKYFWHRVMVKFWNCIINGVVYTYKILLSSFMLLIAIAQFSTNCEQILVNSSEMYPPSFYSVFFLNFDFCLFWSAPKKPSFQNNEKVPIWKFEIQKQKTVEAQRVHARTTY